MRVLAERNGAYDQGQTSYGSEFDRHVEALSKLAEAALENEGNFPECTLVLRSAKSGPARALTQTREILAASNIRVRTILVKIEPERELHALFAALGALTPNGNLGSNIRWARNPQLADVHEQAVYGQVLSWTGDSVRRDADKRNRLVLFDDTHDGLHRARHAFGALWTASECVPAHLLDIRDTESLLSSGAPKGPGRHRDAQPAEGWPLQRH